jgi:hypothetical protein
MLLNLCLSQTQFASKLFGQIVCDVPHGFICLLCGLLSGLKPNKMISSFDITVVLKRGYISKYACRYTLKKVYALL